MPISQLSFFDHTFLAAMDRIQDHVYALLSSLPCSQGISSVLDLCGLSGAADGLMGSGNVGGEIKLNGRTIQIEKLLGEGGFSFVYLARDKSSGREFALKKVSYRHKHRGPLTTS